MSENDFTRLCELCEAMDCRKLTEAERKEYWRIYDAAGEEMEEEMRARRDEPQNLACFV